MSTIAEMWEAGVDAVIADNALNRGGFRDALKTVTGNGLSNAEAFAYIDAVAAEYERLGIINNPTYNNLRGEIINEGKVTAMAQFEALATSLNGLDAALPVLEELRLVELKEDRDEINNALDRLDVLIANEDTDSPPVIRRLVKPVLREGKNLLRQQKQAIRDEIQNLTGDPDEAQ